MSLEEKSGNPPISEIVEESGQTPELIGDVEESSIESPNPEVESSQAILGDVNGSLVPEDECCSKCGKPKLNIDDSEDTSTPSELTCKCSTEQDVKEENESKLNKSAVVQETAQIYKIEAEREASTASGMSSVHEAKELSGNCEEALGGVTSDSEAGSFRVITVIAQKPQSQLESIEKPSGGSREVNKPQQECSPVSGVDEIVSIKEANANVSPATPTQQVRESRVQTLESSSIQSNPQEVGFFTSFFTDSLNILICGILFIIFAILSLVIALKIFPIYNENGDDSEDLDRNSTQGG